MSSVCFNNIHQTAYGARRSVFCGRDSEKKTTELEKLAKKEKAYRDWAHQVSFVGSDVVIFGLTPNQSQSCLAKVMNVTGQSDGEDGPAEDDSGNDEDQYLDGDDEDDEDMQELEDLDPDDEDLDDQEELLNMDEYDLDLLAAPQDLSSNASSPGVRRGLGFMDRNPGATGSGNSSAVGIEDDEFDDDSYPVAAVAAAGAMDGFNDDSMMNLD